MSIINAGSPLPHDGWYKIVHLEGEAPQTVFLKDGGTASWRKKKKNVSRESFIKYRSWGALINAFRELFRKDAVKAIWFKGSCHYSCLPSFKMLFETARAILG